MQIERTFHGLQVELHSRGIGRFFSAGFLFVWLVGWLVGETVVLWILFAGGRLLVTGMPPAPGRAPLETAPALVMGVFLLGWLALWTLGGWLAAREFMRLLWSRDQVRVNRDGLEVTHRVGLLSDSRRFGATELRRIYRREAGSALVAETSNDAFELTRLGTATEQADLLRLLTSELQLDSRPPQPPALPPAWRELRSPEGERILAKDPATRRRQAFVAWCVAVPVGVVAWITARAVSSNPALLALAIIVSAAALGLTWGALWLTCTRLQWKLENGHIVQQRRVGSRVRPLFVAHAVTVEAVKDSDGDTWYYAHATALHAASEPRRTRRTLVRQMHDAAEPRRLAEWISARAGIPFHDLTEPSLPPPDVTALARQLESSGKLGSWAARMVRRLERKP